MDFNLELPADMPESPGKLIVITVDGHVSVKNMSTPEGQLPMFQKVVGGHIEAIGTFSRIAVNGETRACVAFCDDESLLKGKPVNRKATILWHEQLKKRGLPLNDVLCGDIAIVIGNDEFMSEL